MFAKKETELRIKIRPSTMLLPKFGTATMIWFWHRLILVAVEWHGTRFFFFKDSIFFSRKPFIFSCLECFLLLASVRWIAMLRSFNWAVLTVHQWQQQDKPRNSINRNDRSPAIIYVTRHQKYTTILQCLNSFPLLLSWIIASKSYTQNCRRGKKNDLTMAAHVLVANQCSAGFWSTHSTCKSVIWSN